MNATRNPSLDPARGITPWTQPRNGRRVGRTEAVHNLVRAGR
jgi:hypothetical protein